MLKGNLFGFLALALFAVFSSAQAAPPSFKQTPNDIDIEAGKNLDFDLNSLLATTGAGGALRWRIDPPANKPAWLTLDANTGKMTGAPAASDIRLWTFNVQVREEGTETPIQAQVRLTVYGVPTWTLNPIDLGKIPEGSSFSYNLTQHVNLPIAGMPVTYTAKAGTLPSWLSLTSAGMLTGSPTRANLGTFTNVVFILTGAKGDPKETLAKGEVTKVVKPPTWNQAAFTIGNAFEDLPYSKDVSTTEFVSNPEGATACPLVFRQVSLTTAGVASTWLGTSPAGMMAGMPLRKDKGAQVATLELSCTIDGVKYAASAQFKFDVLLVNKAPKWSMDPLNLPDAFTRVMYIQDLIGFVSDLDGDALTFKIVPLESGAPSPSWGSITAAGVFSGTPQNADYGMNTFRIEVADKEFKIAANIKINVRNRPPTWITKPTVLPNGQEDVAYTFDLKNSVNDLDNDALTFTAVDAPSWITISTAGLLTGTPLRANVGLNSFRVRVTDGVSGTDESELRITVALTNKAPIWSMDPVTLPDAPERVAYSQSVASFVTDNDPGDAVTIRKVAGPAWVSIAADGKVTGTPQRGDVGAVVLTVEARDKAGLTKNATVKFNVLKVNRPPVWAANPLLLPDAFTRVAYADNVAARVTDADGDALTFKLIPLQSGNTNPAWGKISTAGAFTGTPTNGDFGTNTFRIEVSDGEATVAVDAQIKVLNRLPTWKAKPTILPNAQEDVAYTFDLKGSVTDLDNDALSFTAVNPPEWLALSTVGVITGTPRRAHVGLNKFNVRVTDSVSGEDVAELQITVVLTNKAPIWTMDPILLPDAPERSAYNQSLAAFVTDNDPNDAVTIRKVTGPAWASIAANGAITGTPQRADVGLAEFTVEAKDKVGLTKNVVVRIQVLKVNRPPVWTQNPIVLPDGLEDAAYAAFNLKPLVTDADGDAVTFALKTGPAWLKVSAAGILSGTPSSPDVGPFTAVFTVNDTEATVEVTGNGKVNRKNYPPAIKIAALVFTVKERATLTENLNQAKYVEDINGDNLTFQLSNAKPFATLTPQGQLTLSPKFADIGTYDFDLRVSDGVLASDAKLKVIVVRDARPPVWQENPIVFETKAREVFSKTLVGKVIDPDGLPLKYTKLSGPAWLTVNADGTITGTPGDDVIGANNFKVRASNDVEGADADLVITVIFKNHPPEWNIETLAFIIKERATFTENLKQAKYVTDVDPDTLTFKVIDVKDWVALTPAGALTLTPKYKEIGSHQIKIEVSDGVDKVVGTMRVTVIRDPRPPVWTTDAIVFNTKARLPFTATLVGKVTDLDGLPLKFTRVSGPAWLSISADGVMTGTPVDANLGDNAFVIKAENDLKSADKDVLVKVDFNNHAPYWTQDPIKLPDGRGDEVYAQSVASFAKDPDVGDTLTFSLEAGAPAWISVTAAGEVKGTPLAANVGVNKFKVRVKDQDNLFAIVNVEIDVKKGNTAPKWSKDPIPLPDVVQDDAFAFDLAPFASDEDGDALTFKKLTGPSWLIAAADGKLTGAPKRADVGSYTATFEVTDGKKTTQVGATGRVLYKNYPPEIKQPALTFQVKERATFLVELKQDQFVKDPDNDALTFTLLDAKDWVVLSSTGKLTLTPKFKDIGTYALKFKVNDGKVDANGVLNIEVLRDPRAPEWLEKPIRFTTRAKVAFTASLVGKVRDLDGLPLTFTKKSGPNWLLVSAAGALYGTPDVADVGENSFVVTATNDKLGADVDVIITVTPANQAPFWTKDPIELPTALVAIAYNQSLASYARDPDTGDTLTFRKVDGAAWIQLDSTGKVTGTPAVADKPESRFRAEVKDQFGLAAVVTVIVPVESVNKPPKWLQEPLRLADATEDSPYSFDLRPFVKDDDFDQTLTFKKISGPAWLLVATNGLITGLPKKSDVGDYTAVFEVSDGKAAVQVGALGRVLKLNHAPIVKPITITMKERESLVVNLALAQYVEDIDGDTLSFTSIALKPFTTLQGTGLLSLRPMNGDIGDHLLKFRVTDGKIAVDGEILLKVIRDARPPKWLQDPIRFTTKATQPFTATLADKVQELDGLPLTFTKISGPDWLTVSSTGTISGVPGEDQVGDNTYVINAKNDLVGASVAVIITVTSTNGKPYWTQNPIKLPNAKATKTYAESVAAFAKDPDGDALTFSKIDGPTWAFVTSSGLFIGTPAESDVGLNVFTVSVTDGKASAQVKVHITVTSGNAVPRWTKDPIPLGDIPVLKLFAFDLVPFVVDEDNDSLAFTKINGPGWLTVSAGGQLSGTPQMTDLGAFTAVFEVTDGKATARVGAYGKVVKPNEPPTINIQALFFTMKEREVLSVNLNDPKYVTNPDGGALKFELLSTPSWVTLTQNGLLTFKPLRPQIGDHTFPMRVTNDKGLSADGPIQAKVLRDTQPPKWLENPIRFTAYVGKFFSASLTGRVVDPEGGTLTFAKVGGPGWLSVSTPGTISGTPAKSDLGENTFAVTARNESSGADVTVIITVKSDDPITDSWAIDEAVPGAKSENLWVIDTSWKWHSQNWLMQELAKNISVYYNALDAARINHTGVYLSTNVQKFRGLPIKDPQGETLLKYQNGNQAASFVRRMNFTKTNYCYTSPIYSMFAFYGQLPGMQMYQNTYFEPEVPMDTLIVTRQLDYYQLYQKNTAQARWTPSDYTDSFIDFHAKGKKSYRISAVAPGCMQMVNPEDTAKPTDPDDPHAIVHPIDGDLGDPQPVADNPYRTLVMKTKGSYYTFDCKVDMRKVLTDYAEKVIFRAYAQAKKRLKLSKTPSEPSDIRVTIGGVNLPGNTNSQADKWYFDSATNEIVFRWHLIDTSVYRPGDRIEVRYKT